MALSKLKTMLEELNINRNKIEFNYDDISITVNDNLIISLDCKENEYCCGILDVGDLYISDLITHFQVTNKILLVQELMNQLLKMISTENSHNLITFSHIESNIVTQALLDKNYKGPFKNVGSFINSKTGSKVYYFIAII